MRTYIKMWNTNTIRARAFKAASGEVGAGVAAVPEERRELLVFLLRFFADVVARKECHKMTATLGLGTHTGVILKLMKNGGGVAP